jgi:hypothetical protein
LIDLLGQEKFLVFHRHQALLEPLILQLDLVLFPLQLLHLLSLAFPRRLSGLTVPQHSFDATLLFLIFGLGSLSWRKIRLGGG